jgi:predicted transposase/invertase (TIGR01784 family)
MILVADCSTLNNPHDRFFKAVFGRTEVAAEFLERYLPAEVAATVDWTTLRAEKETFLDAQLTQHPADLLYAVTMHGGEAGYVYVLFEHKSYVESRINLDLLRYRVRIWEQWLQDGNSGLLPVIIPVVFYHGAARWGAWRRARPRRCCGWFMPSLAWRNRRWRRGLRRRNRRRWNAGWSGF